MPVLRVPVPDPTTPALAGDARNFTMPSQSLQQTQWILAAIAMNTPLVPGAVSFGTTMGAMPTPPREVLCNACTGSMRTANAGVSTPCGEWVPTRCANIIVFERFSTTTWTISGTTRDSAGAALGNCRVVALETGRVAVGGSPVVAETESDGSGLYSMVVPMNTAYWLLGYKVGSPDVGGTTVVTVVPS